MKRNTYDRNTLYEEVWNSPMVQVARRYGISDVMLKKVCSKLDVPTPPRGYWAKVAAGKRPQVPELPHPRKSSIVYGWGLDEDELLLQSEQQPDSFGPLGPEEISIIMEVAASMDYSDGIRLRDMLKKVRYEGGCPGDVRRVNQPQGYTFDDMVSARQASRVAAYIEALGRAAERLGGDLVAPFEFSVLGEKVQIQFVESASKEPHTLTELEAKELEEYESKRDRWMSKPRIRKWDYRFTGRLSAVVLGDRNRHFGTGLPSIEFVEQGDICLGDQLPDVLVAICRIAAQKRRERLEKEEAVRMYEKRVIEAQRQVDIYNAEVSRLERALKESSDYALAEQLRTFARNIDSSGLPGCKEYACWLNAKADWIDPLIVSCDETFGINDGSDIPPQRKSDIRKSLPYDLEGFFRSRGNQPNGTWDGFRIIVEAKG